MRRVLSSWRSGHAPAFAPSNFPCPVGFLGDFVHGIRTNTGWNSGAAETPAPDAKLDSPRMRIKVGGSVQKARLMKQVPPIYPDEARRQYIQADVVLHALITREGTVQDLRVIKGRCMLAEAAIKAVRQWRYAPTLLEGKPLEIETTIAVSFKLGPR